ncbi:polysaccharide deacetylase family protein [Sulfitobacter sp. M22]|uniref:polysaccharide deacetylase family protein n=1 Tax=Sulfitobacter sp. M22 TaxID=2675332 RepID=UPI001F028625|nr:polysaccharide deacetylase family protein [Sulfitobacter sp. M22]MCF7728047.1 polysaccharide deacetylase family protein [Sulfitobacter sp. M22]
MNAQFVISLDFELLWGVRDHADRDTYGKNVLGARDAVPKMLELFAENKICATWATVGFLFCENKEELLASLPDELPTYSNPRLSNFSYIDEVGSDERSDPYYFAPSLISAIHQTPGQEIGTHTLSHFYCLEDGPTLSAFEADIIAAKSLADRRGIELRSIVFPRNQFATEHLALCAKHGITHYRGNPSPWAYQAAKGSEQTSIRRALRLIDAYSGVLGSQAFDIGRGQPKDVAASRFLRPCAGRLTAFHPLHIATIKRGMTAAARDGKGYHLWWHPHNFGQNLEANLEGLGQIITHFTTLRADFGMKSTTMEALK